jgi:cell division protein FtsB
LRWLLPLLLLLLAGLQYRLWWADGGRLELADLRQRAEDQARENERLRERNAALAQQVLDLKNGQTVLELRAREQLGLTRSDEVFYQIIDAEPAPSGPADQDPP